MAQPTNTFDSYDQVGIREDLSDVIYDVSPMDTPAFSMMAKVGASNTLHEWQTDALRSSAANAHIEGDDTTAGARTATTRLTNHCQILKDAITISGTDKGLTKAGRAKEMAYQKVKVGKEVRLDLEKALFDNNAKVAGNSTTAREFAGIPTWLTTNTSVGSGGSDATGDGTDARTDGTQRSLTQTLFDTVMQSIWDNSKMGTTYKVFNSSFQMNVVLGFTGNNNQRSTVDASKDEVRNLVHIYATPWGDVEFVMSRECRGRDQLILCPEHWAIAELRKMTWEPLAKTGDSDKSQVVMECTLESRNQASSGMVADLSTS